MQTWGLQIEKIAYKVPRLGWLLALTSRSERDLGHRFDSPSSIIKHRRLATSQQQTHTTTSKIFGQLQIHRPQSIVQDRTVKTPPYRTATQAKPTHQMPNIMAQYSMAADIMAVSNTMNGFSLPAPIHPTRLINNNGKRRADDYCLLSAFSIPTKKIMLQRTQDTKTILSLPAKALAFNFSKLPQELVLIIMEQITDLPMLINLTIASAAAHQVFIEHPEAIRAIISRHTPNNELVQNLFVHIFSLPTNQALERAFPNAITRRLVRAVCVIRSIGSDGTFCIHEFLRLALDPNIPMDECRYPITLSALASVTMTLSYAVQNNEFCLETQQDKSIQYGSWSWKHKIPEHRLHSLTAELFDNAFWMFQLFQDILLYRTELKSNKEYRHTHMSRVSPSDIIPEVIDDTTEEWKLEAGKTCRDILALRNEIYVRFIVKRRVNRVRTEIEEVRRGKTLTSKDKIDFVVFDLVRAQMGLGILLNRDAFKFDGFPGKNALCDYWWSVEMREGTVTRSPRWKERFEPLRWSV